MLRLRTDGTEWLAAENRTSTSSEQGKWLSELQFMDGVRRVRLIQEHARIIGLFVDAYRRTDVLF